MLEESIAELAALLPGVVALGPALGRLADAMVDCWRRRGKVLIAGNGGSSADAMHFAEELVVRFGTDRQALAAIALCDPTVLTCCANDYGFDRVFSRQVEALGNAGDLLIIMSSSGQSQNLILALQAAKAQGLITAAFLGKTGGQALGLADIELLVPSVSTARIQESHKLLFHTLCRWVDERYQTQSAN
ncbi:MAG: SIS domain-containing protein [Phycisphaerales bacterium]|jgi:D-sedoheptulose 7-phosphate isomerase|nr:SIS domain-containing protein [Phycisphaerales bacterium]